MTIFTEKQNVRREKERKFNCLSRWTAETKIKLTDIRREQRRKQTTSNKGREREEREKRENRGKRGRESLTGNFTFGTFQLWCTFVDAKSNSSGEEKIKANAFVLVLIDFITLCLANCICMMTNFKVIILILPDDVIIREKAFVFVQYLSTDVVAGLKPEKQSKIVWKTFMKSTEIIKANLVILPWARRVDAVVASCFEGIPSVDDPFAFDGKIAQSIHVNLQKNQKHLCNNHDQNRQIHTCQTKKTLVQLSSPKSPNTFLSTLKQHLYFCHDQYNQFS